MVKRKNKIMDENVKSSDVKVDNLDKITLPKRKSYKVLIVSAFLQKLRDNKLYLFSFVVTVIAFCLFSLDKVKEGDGLFGKEDIKQSEKEVNDLLEDKLKLNKQVGIYVKSFKLNKEVKYDTKCSFKSYDLVYEVLSDNKINKYIQNECLGTVLIYSDTLGYVKSESTKNIGTKGFIYVFKDSFMTELDGLTYKKNNNYKLNDDIKDLSSTKLVFHGDKYILETNNELYLINGESLESHISADSLLDKSMYRIGDTSNYRYIVYNEGETQTCYVKSSIEVEDFEDKNIYTIYVVKFDSENLTFTDPFIENVRNRSDSCDTLNEDLDNISK